MASITAAAANLKVNALTARLNNGFVRIYSGTVPANASAALGGATLLAQMTFGATAFAAASGGAATANAIGQDASNDASGTPSFFRCFEADGVTVVMQGTAGATGSGAEMIVTPSPLVAGGTCSISSFTYTQALT